MLGHTFCMHAYIPVGIYNCTVQHIQILLIRIVCVKLNPVKVNKSSYLLYYPPKYLPDNIANTVRYRQLT